MDVHKSFPAACIATTNEQGVTTYVSKRFSTFTGNPRECAAWLLEILRLRFLCRGIPQRIYSISIMRFPRRGKNVLGWEFPMGVIMVVNSM